MSDETTTDTLAEIEGQAADYAPPKGWRVLQVGEVLQPGDEHVSRVDNARSQRVPIGDVVPQYVRYIRRIEPEPDPEPQPEPQPVQIREGRWRTRNGEVRNIIPTPAERSESGRCLWRDAYYYQTWYPSGHYSLNGEHPLDLWEYLGPIEPEPEQIITPDDVAAEALVGVNEWPSVQTLRRKLETTEAALLEQQQQNERLVTQGSQQYMKIQELRSEVSYVQGLLGDERRRFAELETLTSDLRAVNAAQEKGINAAARDKADLQHRLDTVAAEWAVQAETIRGLQTQLEDVKAELVQVSKDRHALQVELDAREQVPQAVSDRFEEGWDAGTARAVETIAEWTEPFRTCGSQSLAWAVLQNLPHIMRTLTGLTDND